jgi:hypothetical protein
MNHSDVYRDRVTVGLPGCHCINLVAEQNDEKVDIRREN